MLKAIGYIVKMSQSLLNEVKYSNMKSTPSMQCSPKKSQSLLNEVKYSNGGLWQLLIFYIKSRNPF